MKIQFKLLAIESVSLDTLRVSKASCKTNNFPSHFRSHVSVVERNESCAFNLFDNQVLALPMNFKGLKIKWIHTQRNVMFRFRHRAWTLKG